MGPLSNEDLDEIMRRRGSTKNDRMKRNLKDAEYGKRKENEMGSDMCQWRKVIYLVR